MSPTGRSWTRSIPHGGKIVGRPDAGEQQELRRVVRARREDDLALGADLLERAVAHRLDADRACAVEQDPVDAGVGEHLDVAARDGRAQVGDRGRAAPAVALGDLEAPGALLRRRR